jgi:hypothetical protein
MGRKTQPLELLNLDARLATKREEKSVGGEVKGLQTPTKRAAEEETSIKGNKRAEKSLNIQIMS